MQDDESRKMFERYALQVSQVISTYQSKYKTEIKKIFLTSTLPSISEAIDQLKSHLTGVEVDAFNPITDIQVPENILKKIIL